MIQVVIVVRQVVDSPIVLTPVVKERNNGVEE